MNPTLRSRVFLSCPQGDEKERLLTSEIRTRLDEELGFDVYVAVEQHSPTGLQDDIFTHLRQSEYFLMLDFRREELVPHLQGVDSTSTEKYYRGSLYVNQEFGIAAFLDTRMLVFQEDGVKKLDGMVKANIANPIPFADRSSLPGLVIATAKAQGWLTGWRNELRITTSSEPTASEAFYLGVLHPRELARYYLGKITNLSDRKTATNVRAFVENHRKSPDGPLVQPRMIELKFGATRPEAVVIPPGKARDFDMMHVFNSEPTVGWLGFNEFLVDSPQAAKEYILTGPGKFEVTYAVYSNEFAPCRVTATIDLTAPR